jgi:hypothetical protein
MSTQVRCHCQSCTMRGLTGPALVITIGILLLLQQVHGGNLSFGNTWPIIFIVIGFLYLASSVASKEGHVESPPPGVPPAPPSGTVPPSAYGNQGQ